MDTSLAVTVLSIVSLAISAFSAGYSMANWHFSSTFVRDKVMKKLEKELRWRLHFNQEMTESTNDAIAK